MGSTVCATTIDKYVGDAMLIFFGDPDTKGVKADAVACVKMAIAMRKRMRELESVWRASGIEKPPRCRTGIRGPGNDAAETRLAGWGGRKKPYASDIEQDRVAALHRLNVSVIVTGGTPPTIAAKRATPIIPIVFAVSGDPVRLAPSAGLPGYKQSNT